MHFKKLAAATLLICALPGISQARDTAVYLPFDKAVAEATRAGKIDGSVKFYLAGNTPTGNVTVLSAGAVTNKKTNAFNKSDEVACEWVAQSAIISLHQAAKSAGANAVTNIVSFYKKNERKDAKTYECHAGALMAGVALKGDLAKVQ
ncbi:MULTISPECIES: excinuclease [Pseudomonas]|uniref:Excinuclease n=1 Tax=Pseudomonas wuhanensis TaxID=2954098 RepID=A0ABY9GQM4_9PSED|nr:MULTISPECIES: excinuclease [unclassified Pseudomonas]WLI12220.1 excinuclease [Pseudomonas sp. FP603]WLI18075.1 excinuclease [Pseudomonas sp. FP607]